MCQFQKLAAPLELFTAPKGSAAPWLRTTALCRVHHSLEQAQSSTFVGKTFDSTFFKEILENLAEDLFL